MSLVTLEQRKRSGQSLWITGRDITYKNHGTGAVMVAMVSCVNDLYGRLAMMQYVPVGRMWGDNVSWSSGAVVMGGGGVYYAGPRTDTMVSSVGIIISRIMARP